MIANETITFLAAQNQRHCDVANGQAKLRPDARESVRRSVMQREGQLWQRRAGAWFAASFPEFDTRGAITVVDCQSSQMLDRLRSKVATMPDPTLPSPMDTDRNLLFGVLALQADLISDTQF